MELHALTLAARSYALLPMYHSLEYVIFTSCNLLPLCCVILYCNVGWCVKGSAVQDRYQQCLVAEWLGLSVTVRVRVRARARKWGFSLFFLPAVYHCDKQSPANRLDMRQLKNINTYMYAIKHITHMCSCQLSRMHKNGRLE